MVRAFVSAVIVLTALGTGPAGAVEPDPPRGGCRRQAIAVPQIEQPFWSDISGDGGVVAFTNGADPVGENPDGSVELFVHRDGELVQVTDLPAGASLRAAISGDGQVAVDGRVVGSEVHFTRHDLVAGTSTPLPPVPRGSSGSLQGIGLDGDGDRAVFSLGTYQPTVHSLDLSTGEVEQVGQTSGGSRPLEVLRDGAAVVYVADVFVYRAALPDGWGQQVFDARDAGLTSVADADVDDQGRFVALRGTMYGDIISYRVVDLTSGEAWNPTVDLHPNRTEQAESAAVSGSGAFVWFGQAEARPYDPDETSELFRRGPHGTIIQATENPDGTIRVLATDRSGTHALALQAGVSGRANGILRISCPLFTDVGLDHRFADDVEWLAGEGATTGFADRSFRPAAAVSRAATAAFLYRLAGSPWVPPPPAPAFPDVLFRHPLSTEVEWVASQGVMSAYVDGRFWPERPVSRQAMAAVLHRWAGEPPTPSPEQPTFVDVSADAPFFAEVEWAASEGISTGSSPGPRFLPNDAVSRQAMAAFLHRTAPLVPPAP